MPAEFVPFPKLSRLFRDCTITEKLDGTNACVVISDDGAISAQSRNRVITPDNDNAGFAAWVEANKAELAKLGPGHHFGEWWGAGIQRRYSLTEKRFSLFNTDRWGQDEARPACCHVVPVLFRGPFSTNEVKHQLGRLEANGSAAAPGFMNPEGLVVFHHASRALSKVTLGGDGHKGASNA
jgi:hypothetical protein